MNQVKAGSTVFSLGGDTFFKDTGKQLGIDAVTGVLTGDNRTVLTAVDAQSDFAAGGMAGRQILNCIFQKITDDGNVGIQRKQQVLL